MPHRIKGLLCVDEEGDGPSGGFLIEPFHHMLCQADQLVHCGLAFLESRLVLIEDSFLIEEDSYPHNHYSFKDFSKYGE